MNKKKDDSLKSLKKITEDLDKLEQKISRQEDIRKIAEEARDKARRHYS